MAVSISERPHQFSFSANEIRYVLQVSNPDAPGCAVEIELYTNETYFLPAKFHAFTVYPDKQGNIYCSIKTYLEALLEFELPDPEGDIIQPVKKQVFHYFIKYRQVTTAERDPSWISDEENGKIVLLGGVEQSKFQRNNFFVSYLTAYKPFLTWFPAKRFVYLDQLHWLTFLLVQPTVTKNFTVNYKLVYTDGSILQLQELVNMDDTLHLLFRIKCGAKAMNLDQLSFTKKIHFYEVSVYDENMVLLANPYRFYIQYNQVYKWYDLFFKNSIGGLDSIRAIGEASKEITTSVEDVEHITFDADWATVRPQKQFSQINIFKRRIIKGEVGFQSSPQMQEALEDILITKEIFAYIDKRWIQVLNLKRSQDMGTSNDSKWSFPLEFTLGYEDAVFTPEATLLGAGNNDPGNAGGGGAGPCDALGRPENAVIELQSSPPNGSYYEYKAHWQIVPTYMGLVQFEWKVAGTNNWQPLPKINNSTATFVTYSLLLQTDVVHVLRITFVCPNDVRITNSTEAEWG